MDTISHHQQPLTQSQSSSSARTRTSNDCNSSPEFEFWMLRNPSFPQPNLLSADELIHDGVLLPLHLLPTATTKPYPPQPDTETTSPELPTHESETEPSSRPESSSSSSTSTFSASKRWKDIFKKKNAENNNTVEDKEKEKDKGKKKERKTASGAGGSAELNINIWPFSRSRSAGNNATTRPRLFPGAPSTRKVNSAPCSRSNSAGESKSRKWPSSPGRAGVHVGRSSPVWQVRRAKNPDPHAANNTEKGPKKKETATCRRSKGGSSGTKARVLNLNVPMCIGYRQHLSCRSDENGAVCDAGGIRGGSNHNVGGGGDGNDGGSGGNLFNLRNLFTKKSIVTSH